MLNSVIKVLCLGTFVCFVSVCFGHNDNLINAYSSEVKKQWVKEMESSKYMPSPLDIYLETPDIIRKYGYPVETHTVTTEDGYLLTVHRIPGSPRAASSGVKTPVLLAHGILGASDLWVLAGPEKGLGFLLADSGHDVWLGNTRGNYYSRRHVTLSPRNPNFWDYTWHEIGLYDMPALIDYVLDHTNQTQLIYIGHSMGTTTFFVMASSRPEYNAKIRLMVALSPVVFNNQVRSPIANLVIPFMDVIYKVFVRLGQHEIFPRNLIKLRMLVLLCGDGRLMQKHCLVVYHLLFGSNGKQLNTTLLPTYWANVLQGTSVSTVYHFIQNYQTGRFQVFDRTGERGRVMPEYNLTRVAAPVSLHYAMNDAFLHPNGVIRLSKVLPNVVRLVRLPDETSNHMDFTFSDQVKQMVFKYVLEIMGKFKII